MCDFGISALVVGIVGTVVSTTMGIVSSVQQANAAQAQANYQAEVAKQNAKIAQQNADQTRQEGIEESRMQRMKTLQAVGSQQAAMAANGIDISNGTALDIVEDTASMGELDALTTRYNAETKAVGYEQTANNFNNQANLDIYAGQNAYKAGMTNAVAAGFGGLAQTASVASKWYSPNSLGYNSSTEYTTKTSNKTNGGYLGTLPNLNF